MSALQEIQDQLQDTEAALAELDRAIAQDRFGAMAAMAGSLRKRREQLEQQFMAATKRLGLKVCSYRLFRDGEQPKLAGLAGALADFQTMFSVTFNAIKNGPRERSRIGIEVEQASAFDFAYAFAGSVGIVLTMQDQQVLYGSTEFDLTIQSIAEVARARTPAEVSELSKRLGNASIREVYKWAKVHVDALLGAEIQWREGTTVQQNLLMQLPEFKKLAETIAETSEETVEEIRLTGELVGADTDRRTFHMKFPSGDEIRGHFTDAINASHKVTIPKVYRAILSKTTITQFSIDTDDVRYFLERLEEPS